MEATTQTLEAAFRKVFDGLRAGSPDALMQFLAESALVIDEDTPFVLDKAAFREHIGFHFGGMWESIALVTREETFAVLGTTGVITGLFTLRGKPRDSGFRLRYGNVSLVCAWENGAWSALSLVLGPLSGHITDGSPA